MQHTPKRLLATSPVTLALSLAVVSFGCASDGSTTSGEAPATAEGGEPGTSLEASSGQDASPIDESVEGYTKLEGLLTLYYDAGKGRVLFEPTATEQELLYYVSLPRGLGSNDVGLDRAQLGPRRLVHFRRHGPRVHLVAPNVDWRSSSPSEVERDGVRDAFAESVLWGFDVVAADGERTLVDGTDFFLRDAHGIASTLRATGQGAFSPDRSRSGIAEDGLASFPENTEVEVLETFRSDAPGSEVRSTAADAGSVSFRVRHSFVALPELDADANAYRPRAFDPRSGFFATSWDDAHTPIDRPTTRRVLTRHHLTHDEPIVYYIDTAAPEPIRTALLEGARYWTPVFEKAGFPGGFRAELLPEGVDVQDVRYHVVTWVNRSTRGWSYGMTVSDPRTGEILKGHVTLGALRVRQDVMLLEGLLSPYGDGKDRDERVLAAALDRIRQLSAHEIGHTLGLAHNFAASVDGRASVMDYPAPLVKVNEAGELDVADAYRDGCGAWDEAAIRYGYAEFEDEEAGLAAVLADMRAQGLHYLSDADARGAGRAHPLANLWDNGDDPLEALREAYRVRRIALDRLSSDALTPGRPLAELERVFVPVYLHHRYQIEAAARMLGGREFDYAIVGDDDAQGLRTVDGERQRAALDLLFESLDPAFLAIRPDLRALFVPPPPGHSRDRESFVPGRRQFDPSAAVRASVEVTLDFLLDRERLARVAEQRDEDGQATLAAVFDRLVALVASASDADEAPYVAEVREATVERMMQLATDEGANTLVRSAAWSALESAAGRLGDARANAELARFLEDPEEHAPTGRGARVPPGSPIGCGW